MTKQLLSFHNDVSIKAKYVARLEEHHQLDKIIQGVGYNDNGRGCAVGCTLENYDHDRYPIELGLPVWLAHLEDGILEALPKEKVPQFAVDFLQSIPVGVCVENVKWRLAILRHKKSLVLLADNKEPYAEQCRQAIQQVIDYCVQELKGESAAWSAARSAARSAVRSAAWSDHYEWEAETLLKLLAECK